MIIFGDAFYGNHKLDLQYKWKYKIGMRKVIIPPLIEWQEKYY
jgi:hypothetical protein